MSTEIIAEIAQGFEGCPDQARLLLKAAAVSGADSAKFQLVYADELATPDYLHYELFRSLEMSDATWSNLSEYARNLGIHLQLDIFGIRSLNLAVDIGVDAVKLHATDIANIALLIAVAKSDVKNVILGAGGASLDELENTLRILNGKKVVIMLGFQGYPTPNESNQIGRIRFLLQKFSLIHPNLTIGFADHAPQDGGLSYALAATAIGAGAKVIEKHITLASIMKMEDHESALNPDEFQIFTQTVKSCSEALGGQGEGYDFNMSISELDYRKMIRRHVVASRDIEAGTKITPADLLLKRTSSELFISDIEGVYQKIVKRRILKNSPLNFDDIQ
jgi:N,N'-diacetyllegionaminate synthase